MKDMLVAVWHAFPAAPETGPLKRLRIHSMTACTLAAIGIALIDPIARAGWPGVALVTAIAVHASLVTIRYWRTKQRLDSEHQDAILVAVRSARERDGAAQEPSS